jgi:hypothetical protein
MTLLKNIRIHCSSLKYKNYAILFFGASGSGKSTTVNNAKNNCFKLLIDDKAYINRKYNIPFISDKISKTKAYPILGSFKIIKSNYVKIAKVNPIKRILFFNRAIFEIPYNNYSSKNIRIKRFIEITEIAKLIPTFELRLSNDRTFVPILKKFIEDKILKHPKS